MTTEWRAIAGEVGRYAVSDAGEVMAMNFSGSGLPGILKPNMGRGYYSVQISARRRVTVHKLVAKAFIGPRPDGMQINHKNGIKTDNRATNLEYCTRSQNMKHAHATGLQCNKGESHSQHKLKEADVLRIRDLLALGLSQAEIARSYGVTPSNISRIKSGDAWPHLIATNVAAADDKSVCGG